jgi:hypothetical protein
MQPENALLVYSLTEYPPATDYDLASQVDYIYDRASQPESVFHVEFVCH